MKTKLLKSVATSAIVIGSIAPTITTVLADTTSDLNDAKTKLEESSKILSEKKAVYNNLSKLQVQTISNLEKAKADLITKQKAYEEIKGYADSITEEDLANAKAEVDAAQTVVNDAQAKADDLKARFETANAELNEAQSAYNACKEAYDSAVAAQEQAKTDEAKADADKAETADTNAKADVEKTEQEQTKAETEVGKAEEKVKETTTAKDNAQAKVDDAEATVTEAVKKAQEEADKAQVVVNQKNEELAGVKADAGTKEENYISLKQKADEASANVDEAKRVVSNRETVLDEKQKILDRAQAELEKATGDKAELEKKVASAQKEVDNATSALEQANKDLQAAKDNANNISTLLAQAEKNLTVSEKELADAKAGLEKAQVIYKTIYGDFTYEAEEKGAPTSFTLPEKINGVDSKNIKWKETSNTFYGADSYLAQLNSGSPVTPDYWRGYTMIAEGNNSTNYLSYNYDELEQLKKEKAEFESEGYTVTVYNDAVVETENYTFEGTYTGTDGKQHTAELVLKVVGGTKRDRDDEKAFHKKYYNRPSDTLFL